MHAELQLSNDILKNLTLLQLEEMLQRNRRSLTQFPSMPYPDGFVTVHCGNKLIYSELDYNVVDEHNLFQKNYTSMTGK